ncbi:heparinase II/III family protein [Dyadobacter sp. 3J3]|uniref:heparinase II/III domain-containing protein n=1 Tax=Dyadobacter sp. 3J3 TaxID=2606600 RepID=UPI00135A73E7|nr:heparinase II/III family protein [Dyadobacter sp. 3J3]
MRKELKYILLGLLFCFSGSFAQTEKLADSVWQNLPEHPRLFANQTKITLLKSQKDETSIQLLKLLKNEADQYLVADKIMYPSQGFKFGAMRQVQGRILALSLAYRVFGEKKYFERARNELMEIAELPDWCPGHFLDVGEGALAAGIGFDWLYDELSLKEREKVKNAIVRNALLPSLEVKESNINKSWLNGTFNWNPVCHGGLAVAALSIAESEPELSRRIVERAIQYLPIAGNEYKPDGAYPEGPSYWSYGTSFYVIAIEALRTVVGTSFDLEKKEGFLKTADYKKHMLGTIGEEFNYSDYHVENLNEPIMLWFGKELNRSDLVADEIKKIQEGLQQDTDANVPKNVSLNRHFPLEILWWVPDLRNDKQKSLTKHYTSQGNLDLGVMRSMWNDPKAVYVTIKGGTPDYSHAHMDVGSFVLEARGVRWAVDLGTENYDKMRAAKIDLWNYSQSSSRWTTFRVGSESHNILRFDGGNQQIDGKATIKVLKTKTEAIGNKVDLTSLYSKKVKKVERTILLNADKSVSILDEWTTKDATVDVAWQWITMANVSKTASGLLLEQDGESLELLIEQPLTLRGISIEIEDVSAPKNLQDSPNPGLKRIVIKQTTPAKSEGMLFIKVNSVITNR